VAPAERPGVFVTLEGGEGAGKSTVACALSDRLRELGHDTTVTREPAGTGLGVAVKSIFEQQAAGKLTEISPLSELLLFEAARFQNVREIILPALERGQVVLCDRFTDSSLAYQSYGRGLDLEMVRRLNILATGGLQPALTLLLDAPPETGLSRARHREDQPDAIGAESVEFHTRVREGFLELAKAEPDRIIIIDATQPVDDVTETALKAIRPLLPARG